MRFAVITGGMVFCLAGAILIGGLFPLFALLYITAFTYLMDRITALEAPDHPGQEFPAGTGLSIALGLVHFPLLFGGVWALAGDVLDPGQKIALFFALGLFLGQVGNSNAHELIHKSARPVRRLGVAVYSSLLFGHHASAHPKIHHVHAATDADPNSARLGETYYRFALRAWIGSFRKGFKAETEMLNRKAASPLAHPYLGYLVVSIVSLAVSAVLAGVAGVAVHIALALHAQSQLLLSDYVQHYGLRRRTQPNGKPEPVGPEHSWNAPHGFSSGLMLNAPRHSDHHSHPSKAYPGLDLDRDAMPILPYSLPIMASIALIPGLWRRMMDRRAKTWAAE